MTSREVIQRLREDGWTLKHIVGSHHQFVHPAKPGKVTVPHPKRELAIGLIKAIERQAGIKLR